MKSPKWNDDELKLALELYLSHDLKWLSKISDATPEIIALSEILNGLDYAQNISVEKYRSTGSIRMKLANFKSLDERYGKSSLSNGSLGDKSIWTDYSKKYEELRKDCISILEKHYVGAFSPRVSEYIGRVKENSLPSSDEREISNLISAAYELLNEIKKRDEIGKEEKLKRLCSDFTLYVDEHRYLVEKEEYIEHGGINQVPVNEPIKIGRHVREVIESLIEQKKISPMDILNFTSETWSRSTFHIGYPLMMEIHDENELDSILEDENGYTRYWKKVYLINGKKYAICKEWYENNRVHFDRWYESFDSDGFSMPLQTFKRVLTYMKKIDSREVCIKVEELEKTFPEIEDWPRTIDRMVSLGMLTGFQGSDRELVIDDYDVFFDALNNPGKYVVKG